MQRIKTALKTILPFTTIASFIIGLIIGLEYIFLLSKESYISGLPFFEQAALLGNSFFLLYIPVLILSLIVFFFAFFFYSYKKASTIILYTYSMLLSFFFCFTILVHLDIFIYTLNGWSVYSLSKLNNIVLLMLLFGLAIVLAVKKARKIHNFVLMRTKQAAVIIFLISVIIFSPILLKSGSGLWQPPEGFPGREGSGAALPNIILFCADGLDTRHMGVYGYEKDTTPNLEKISFWKYTRAYSNSDNSRSSTVSVLTGRSPLETKVTSTSDILRGHDSFYHLPAILGGLGYFNIDLNDFWVTSSSKCNLLDGFDLENGSQIRLRNSPALIRNLQREFPVEKYFLNNLFNRYTERLSFMIGCRKDLPLLERGNIGTFWYEFKYDPIWIKLLEETIPAVDRPFFVHLHLMSTHPLAFGKGHFRWRHGIKLAPLPADEKNLIWQLYDDSVLTVDRYFGRIVEALKSSRKLDDTLIIFYTDHCQKHFISSLEDTVKYPVPLIVHLPGQKETFLVEEPVQYLDIAPSILALLGQPIPDWMEGEVIFGESNSSSYDVSRPLIATISAEGSEDKNGLSHELRDVLALRLVSDDKCYIYSIDSQSGALFDLSGDPHDYRVVNDGTLIQEYHEILCQQLKEKGVDLNNILHREESSEEEL